MPSRYAWSRRKLVAALGGAASTLAGCSGGSEPGRTTRTRTEVTNSKTATSTTSTAKDTTSTATRFCDEPSKESGVTHLYPLGEWHEETRDVAPGWRFAVIDIELTTTFELVHSEQSYETPDGTQLAFVTTAVAHAKPTWRKWYSSDRFVLWLDGTVYEPEMYFPDLLFSKNVRMLEFRRVGHAGQYTAEGYTVPTGKVERIWWVFSLPDAVSRSDVRIAFDGTDEGPKPDSSQSSYPVRWMPSKTC